MAVRSLTAFFAVTLASTCCPPSAIAGDAVSVRDFGARGDGTTDDTPAVRSALAASNAVRFPPGVYVVTDGIDLPKSAPIKGMGAPQVVIA